MKVLLKRIYNCSTYCIGHIYVDGTYICDTIEDTDRGLDKSWPLSKIVKTKVKSKTAIPTGIYTLTLNIVSPKFSQVEYYKNFCKGRLPRLLQVPDFGFFQLMRQALSGNGFGFPKSDAVYALKEDVKAVE